MLFQKLQKCCVVELLTSITPHFLWFSRFFFNEFLECSCCTFSLFILKRNRSCIFSMIVNYCENKLVVFVVFCEARPVYQINTPTRIFVVSLYLNSLKLLDYSREYFFSDCFSNFLRLFLLVHL